MGLQVPKNVRDLKKALAKELAENQKIREELNQRDATIVALRAAALRNLRVRKQQREELREELDIKGRELQQLRDEMVPLRQEVEEEKRLRINMEKELEKEKENRTELVCLSNIGTGIDSKVIDTIDGRFRYQYKKTLVDDTIVVPGAAVQ